jgi:hypothetical protein
MRAVIVAQRQDCNGNLGLAGVLARSEIGRSVPLRAVLFEGAARDTAMLRPRLPNALARAPIELLRPSERAALNALGHRATPILLLFDARARLRLAAPVSPDPVETVALRRALTHLVTNDPLK